MLFTGHGAPSLLSQPHDDKMSEAYPAFFNGTR